MIPYDWFERAQARIAAHIFTTPLTLDTHRRIYIKWENRQVTGSFKPRGAINKVLALTEGESKAGLVAVSAGNHGQGVALAGSLVGARVEVFVPMHAVPTKLESIRQLGAEVRVIEGGYAEAESAGRRYAEQQGKVFVSPYNDGQVIAGQGTLALEALAQLSHMADPGTVTAESISNWIVPTGGGGLISACGAVFASLKRHPRLIGVQPAASAFSYSLYHYHTQENVSDDPTLADGLSGAVEEGSVTIPMMQNYVDDLLTVTEDEIAKAIAFAWHVYGEQIEGSGAVGLAAVLAGKVREGPTLIIVSGGNIEPKVHERIILQQGAAQWS